MTPAQDAPSIVGGTEPYKERLISTQERAESQNRSIPRGKEKTPPETKKED